MMDNYRTAPKLYHKGQKEKGAFYQLPQKTMDKIFSTFSGKQGNILKLLIVLLGTAGDGSFAPSEKWIKERTGITKQNYHRTMDELVSLGFITKDGKKIILNLDTFKDDKQHDDQQSHPQTEKGTHDDGISTLDDDYNKKLIKNKKIIDKQLTVDNESSRIAEALKKIGIEYAPNTKKALYELIGEEPQASVIIELINKNNNVWQRNKHQTSNYRYAIFVDLIKKQYHAIRRQRESYFMEQERMQEERKTLSAIDYDKISEMANPKPQTGLDDISNLLDEEFQDESPITHPSNEHPRSLDILAELARQRRALDDDGDTDEEDF